MSEQNALYFTLYICFWGFFVHIWHLECLVCRPCRLVDPGAPLTTHWSSFCYQPGVWLLRNATLTKSGMCSLWPRDFWKQWSPSASPVSVVSSVGDAGVPGGIISPLHSAKFGCFVTCWDALSIYLFDLVALKVNSRPSFCVRRCFRSSVSWPLLPLTSPLNGRSWWVAHLGHMFVLVFFWN